MRPGWFRVDRDSWLWALPAGQFRVALELLRRANLAESKVPVDGVLVVIPRGCALFARREIAAACGVSEKVVRTTLLTMTGDDTATVTRSRPHRSAPSIVRFNNFDDFNPIGGQGGVSYGAQGKAQARPTESQKRAQERAQGELPISTASANSYAGPEEAGAQAGAQGISKRGPRKGPSEARSRQTTPMPLAPLAGVDAKPTKARSKRKPQPAALLLNAFAKGAGSCFSLPELDGRTAPALNKLWRDLNKSEAAYTFEDVERAGRATASWAKRRDLTIGVGWILRGANLADALTAGRKLNGTDREVKVAISVTVKRRASDALRGYKWIDRDDGKVERHWVGVSK